MSKPTTDSDQRRIWSHFQNRAVGTFDASLPRLDFILKRIARRADTTSPQILNVGIGNGHLERTAKDRGWFIHSLDPDTEASLRLKSYGIPSHIGTVDQIPLPDATFDFVVASEVLEHLSDRDRRLGLGEIARVLKPSAWFLGTVPFGEDLAAGQTVCPKCGEVFHRWGHKKSFDLEELRSELTPFFQIVEFRRTAFVTFRGQSVPAKFKSLVRLVLAKQGQMIAVPTIYWCARRRASY